MSVLSSRFLILKMKYLILQQGTLTRKRLRANMKGPRVGFCFCLFFNPRAPGRQDQERGAEGAQLGKSLGSSAGRKDKGEKWNVKLMALHGKNLFWNRFFHSPTCWIKRPPWVHVLFKTHSPTLETRCMVAGRLRPCYQNATRIPAGERTFSAILEHLL